MRRKEKEMTSKEDIEKFISQSKVCRLAMVDNDKPYVVPMNFGYKDGQLFFHCAKEGKKVDLMKKNPNICFEFDELVQLKKAKLACDWGVDFKSVIGWGKALFLEDLEEKTTALNCIMSQYSGREFEYEGKMLEKTLVIKVIIEEMTGKSS